MRAFTSIQGDTMQHFIIAISNAILAHDTRSAFIALRDMRDLGMLADYSAVCGQSVELLESCIRLIDVV